MSTDPAVVDALRAELARAASTLQAASARTEALAEFVPERRVLGLPLAARMRPLGRVWRLGVLLLEADASEPRLFATGMLTRAQPPGRAGYQSRSAEVRREYRAAAQKGRFAEGETVDFDAVPIDVDALDELPASSPILVRADGVFVRWNGSADPAAVVPVSSYLAERVELLAHPPQGA